MVLHHREHEPGEPRTRARTATARSSTARTVSYHHNLYAHHSDRTPRPAACQLDFRNNVIYDFNGGSGYNHGQKATLNYVGNYVIPGPSHRETCFDIRTLQQPEFGCRIKIFFANNINVDSAEATETTASS